MRKAKYRFTKVAKVIIMQLLICSIGIICGFTWEAYNENTRWEKLFYPGTGIASIDLNGMTEDEGKKQLKSELIGELNDYKLIVEINGSSFILDCSKLIKKFDVDAIVDEAFNVGKNGDFRDKYDIIKKGILKDISLYFEYDRDYLNSFISNIEEKINKEPVNAIMRIDSEGSIKIADDMSGIKVNTKELDLCIKDTINNRCFENTGITIPVEEIKAPITKDMLLSIDARIASTDTDFSLSSKEREDNIIIAVKAINGTLLMPGEVFSFNEVVGEITEENGFKAAPVLQSVDYKSGIGGGVCQVSSTLYNTVLKGGLNAMERTSHRLPLSYINMGLDATVYWGSIDFKFENTLDYPIYIGSYIKGKEIYIDFYSNSSLLNKEYIINIDIYSTVPAKIQIIEDEDLAFGESVTVRKGSKGYWVMVTRSTYENGELVDSEIISDDYYEPVDEIIRKGL